MTNASAKHALLGGVSSQSTDRSTVFAATRSVRARTQLALLAQMRRKCASRPLPQAPSGSIAAVHLARIEHRAHDGNIYSLTRSLGCCCCTGSAACVRRTGWAFPSSSSSCCCCCCSCSCSCSCKMDVAFSGICGASLGFVAGKNSGVAGFLGDYAALTEQMQPTRLGEKRRFKHRKLAQPAQQLWRNRGQISVVKEWSRHDEGLIHSACVCVCV